ncbi:type IX secretion system sortase PorU [Apibacter raozihei]|uniref:type IX secretion system sortase PorU n=1 Tax=Apibacter raozihei TaxID=2500547 RepID=UPI000FE3BBEB|nr:type IX secretion system sortase PorU [Apibacter raozihei]
MKKYKHFLSIFILVFFCSMFLKAQTIYLQWEGLKEAYDTENKSSKFPYFSNHHYSLEGGIPTLNYSESTNYVGEITLTDLQWVPVNLSELGDMPISSLPNNDEFAAGFNSARSKRVLSVSIRTFKKTGNTIYQLKSFTISKATRLSTSSTNYKITGSTESIFENGDWFKIKVNKTGIFKINRNFLQSLGINVNSVNPKTIRIFGNGGKMLPEPTSSFRYDNIQENAIFVAGEEDGVFNNDDYILFYAQGPDYWDRSNGKNIKHKKNIYEDYAYYFININQTQGKRISSTSYQTPNSTQYTEYDDYQFYEEDALNLNEVGKMWLGENLGVRNNLELNFPVHALAQSTINWRFYWVSRNGTNGKVNILYNDSQVYSTTLTPASNELDFSLRNVSQMLEPTNNLLKFTLNFDNSLNPSAQLYPDYFEVIYKQKLQFNGSQMNFRTLDNIENGNIYGFNFSSGNTFEVWDVSDYVNARKLEKSQEGNKYSYQFSSATFKNEFIAFNPDHAYTPETVGRMPNQALHSLSDSDYIIITVPEFITQANRLKTFHKTRNNLQVDVVTVNQIYNEFSSGGQDLAGIRDFLRYLYNKDDGKLKYALLLGSASYDFKNKTKTGYNLIPTYQSYNSRNLEFSFASDDFISILDDNEAIMVGEDANLSANQLDIAVGRMIAKNVSEATLCIDKAIKYDNGNAPQGTPFGDWRLKTSLIVDIDRSSYNFHETIENSISKNIFEAEHTEFTLRKLYIDAFTADYTSGGARFPQVTEAIKNALNNGNLIINYFGHGGPSSISQYRLLAKDDLFNLSNFTNDYSRLPLFITVSCDISVWDNPGINSIGDMLYLKENGGAGSLITTNRAIYIDYGINMNPVIMKNILSKDNSGKNYVSMAEALRLSKAEVLDGDNRKVAFLGDPAQSLAKPKREIKLTKINGIEADSFSGTLRALDFITLEGEVLNESGAIDTSFSGNIQTTLFDKPVDKKTLNNFNYSYLNPPMQYKEQINAIYRGGSQVKNGIFKIEFYIPKDINYEVGNGKLILYADNSLIDAFNFKNDIKVGDINPEGINDNEGPKIRLHMNNLNFANGGITDRSPYLLACVTDDSGINSTGLGVGHDITGILDNNVNNTIILNEFYTGGEISPCLNPDLKDFQKGKVWYRLYDLEPGNHTIKFKVWDINNNSSTASLDFIVMENGEQGLIIKRLLNWPNPFTTKTFFHFEHNCPDILEVQVQIFTVSGKLVKTINQTVTSEPFHEGYRTDKYGLEWNGLDDFGDKIGKGVYIYRVKVKGTSDMCKGSVSQVEKLVILK